MYCTYLKSCIVIIWNYLHTIYSSFAENIKLFMHITVLCRLLVYVLKYSLPETFLNAWYNQLFGKSRGDTPDFLLLLLLFLWNILVLLYDEAINEKKKWNSICIWFWNIYSYKLVILAALITVNCSSCLLA